MFKKSFYLAAVFSTALFASCQHDPQIVNSTWHKPGEGGTISHNSMKPETVNSEAKNHSEMKSAPEAANQPFDLQFLDTMIAHHDGAIQMAKSAASKSTNAELKTFADKIVVEQTREITEMKKWREQWFAGKPSALNMEMAGMANSMKGMDAAKLNAADGSAYDSEFVNQMLPHHEGAVVMAREALTKAEHPEIKQLASQIVSTQESEIKQMQAWKTEWAKKA